MTLDAQALKLPSSESNNTGGYVKDPIALLNRDLGLADAMIDSLRNTTEPDTESFATDGSCKSLRYLIGEETEKSLFGRLKLIDQRLPQKYKASENTQVGPIRPLLCRKNG